MFNASKGMRKFLLIVVLFVVGTMGKVLPGTLHPSEMFVLDLSIQTRYSGAIVSCTKIAIFKGGSKGTNIGVVFNQKWQGLDNLGQVGFIIGATGALINTTSWHSDYLFIIYKDKMFVCKTSAARVFARNVGEWSETEVANWLIKNLIIS